MSKEKALIIKFEGEVKGGRLILAHPERLKVYLNKNFEGKKVEMTFRKLVKQRTDPQVRYYFGVVVKMIQAVFKEGGNDFSAEEVHEFLKSLFLFKEVVNEKTGEVYKVPLSLSRMGEVSTLLMSEYKEKIQQWAMEHFSLYIPDPGENYVVDENYYQV